MKRNKGIEMLEVDSVSRRGRLRDALNLLLEAVKEGSFDTDLYLAAANMAYHLGDLEKAEQLVGRLLVLDPEDGMGWRLFGEIRTRRNEIIRGSGPDRLMELSFPERDDLDHEFETELELMEIRGFDMNLIDQERSLDFDTITYADICARQGYYNKALKIYQDHLKKNPDNEELRKKIDDIRKRLDDD